MMLMWQKWLRARMVLGWALFKHVLFAPFAGGKHGAARWLSTMRAEGLGATAADNWQQYERASRCIGCGLCDVFGDAQLPQVSLWMQGGARLQADADTLAEVAQSLRRLAPQIDSVCPTQASAAATAAVIENHAQSLRK